MNNFFEINNATFKVSGSEKVKNVSFSIKKEGDIVCLLGPSGIGKTTILRSIAGLEKISKGQIIVYGKTYPLIEFGYDNSVVDALYIRDKSKGWVGFIKYSPFLNKINLITPLGIGDYNGECN